MKRAGLWLFLLGKRMMKRAAFVMLCIAAPLFIFFLQRAYQGEETGIRAVFWREEGTLARAAGDRLLAYEGRIRFYEAESEDMVKEEIQSGRADCGYIFREDAMDKNITMYRKKDARIAELVRETVYSQVFAVLSGREYTDYMEGILPGGESGLMESVEKYLHNNRTFCVEYVEENRIMPPATHRAEFPAQGILLYFIFTAVLCGTADAVKDREEKRFVRLGRPWLVEAAVIFLPFAVSVLISLGCLAFAGGPGVRDPVYWRVCLILPALGCLLARCFKSSRALAAGMPFLLLAGGVLFLFH